MESLVLAQHGDSNHLEGHIVLDESQLGPGLMALMPSGRRRLDSTGQMEGNRFVMPHSAPPVARELLTAAASRGRKSQHNQLDGTMLAKIVDNGAQHPSDFTSRLSEANERLASMNHNYNRRALLSAQQQMATRTNQRRLVAKGGPSVGGRQAVSRQESRKSQSRPYVSKAKRRPPVKSEEAEEDNEKASDRRADAFDRDDDGDDRPEASTGRGERRRDEEEPAGADRDEADEADADEDDDKDDESAKSKGRPSSGRRQARLRQAASSGRKQRRPSSRDADDAGGADNEERADEDDESADSTNARRVTVGSGSGDPETPKASKRSLEVVEVVHEPASEGTSNLKNGAEINVDLQAAAGHHHGHHGHYYQYVEVPKKKAWKFGFKRGNHKHEIARHEKGHKHKFHSSFKWHAKEKCKKKKKCKSVGKMTWEYKHHKKHHP